VVRLVFHVPSGYGGPEPIVSTASASSFTPDPNPSNNAASSTTAVVRSADLRLELTGPASATPPSHLAYAIVVTNHGPSDAAGVVVSDPEPPGLTFVPHDGRCGTALPCPLGTVRAGKSRTFGVVFALTEDYVGPDPIANVATVTTTTPDPDSGSDSDTVWTNLDAAVATQGFYTLTPCRLVDTRDASGPRGGPALSAGWERFFSIAGACDVPESAKAIAVNVAVTASTASGHLRLYPAGAPVPLAAAVSYRAGQTRSSNALVRLNAAGEMAVYCGQGAGTAHIVLDVVGYFE